MGTASAKDSVLASIGGRPVVIWGARMTGIGFARFANSNGLEVLGFVDSDPALHGTRVNGVPVRPPQSLLDLRRSRRPFVVVVAVALKAEEIMHSLAPFGLGEQDVVIYSDYCSVFYTIDVVGTCNLKCASCVHSMPDHGMPLGLMPFDTFKAVVAKIKREAPLLTHVGLYNWGEPFLHPQLPEIIDHLHENGAAVAVSSNLSVRFEDRIDRVIKASPDYLKISLSGYYPKAYDATHNGGDINLVKSNMYRLRYLIDKHKANTYVDVNYHLYRDNNGVNLQKMRDLCRELDFALSTVYALVMPLERVLAYCDGKPTADTLALSENLLVTIPEGIKAAAARKCSGCTYRDNQVNINFDLNVPVCCTVADRATATAAPNFLETTPESLTRAKNAMAICGKCMHYGLPEYNLGYNQKGWDEFARAKASTDLAKPAWHGDEVPA